ncbi:hypothetical protein [Haloferax larsenii]|uniref:Uncharacterized protein n=1 Tax=Haloferax larsenii TaxID=302484 RepID=A0A1H7UZE6_HALLR|nr:hypothetical protein [Haloferax larsenii]SEM02149.1 hypothetical protein SAMN04488691_11534 [Haloferax larsenii]
MRDTPMRRLAGLLVLLGCLFAFTVAFGALSPNPAVGSYPDGKHLDADYDAWVGEKTEVWGTVVQTDPLVIEDEFGAGESIRLELTGTTLDPQLGERVAVFGVVQPGHTLRVVNAFTIPATNFTYMYLVSFGAGLWVLTRLVRTWRVDRRTWSLEPRPTPLSWRRLLGVDNSTESRPYQTEGDDA